MPAIRTNQKYKNAESSSSKQEKKKKAPPHQVKANAIPGKQKLKASLRQAKRLLAKVSRVIAPLLVEILRLNRRDLPPMCGWIQSVGYRRWKQKWSKQRLLPRRGIWLYDITKSSSSVSFFSGLPCSHFELSLYMAERQKVTRKLNQTKKALQTVKGSEKSKLEDELLKHRIDLGYILVRSTT